MSKEECALLLAEATELLRNATYQDGYAVVFTQDCEALEEIVVKLNGDEQ